ncbi:choline-sulfatase [Caenimonas soli]|uniref:choline-sulfatase n=1 Tax=Caenimonas soli TaxID=2735555 RepID=UPI001553F657|nr:choline-sulfatase [Caenimonas soli]NPC59115.1 choline-sulfatase [Caenimonas soli]
MTKRPNILLIMADQLNASFLPMYGNAIAKTPHLQALAERGTTFANAYCNYPICAPSRYSMLSGRLPHAINAFDNASELPASTPTVMHYLRELGYATTLCGKMHFVGPDQLHGYQDRLVTDIYPADFAWVPDWTKGPRNAPTGISMRAVIEAGPCLRSLQIDYDDETEFNAQQKMFNIARGDRSQPFFLTVSFSHPHSPYTASQEHWDRYKHEEIDAPKVGPLPVEKMDKHSEWLYYSHGRDRYDIQPQHVQNARHSYYAMISYVDDKVGRLMKILRDTGLEEDTLVIFTSDHGEMMGERGMWFKQCFFEGSVKVPLIIAGAGWSHKGGVDELVSLVDLMPTMLDVATDGAPPEMRGPTDGNSLRRFSAETDSQWPNLVFSEYSDMGVCAPCRMVRSGNLKLIYTHGYPSQLYDLSTDPLELENLSGDPGCALGEARLLRLLLSNWDPESINERVLRSQRERELIYSVTSRAQNNWSWMWRPDDDRRYVRSGGDAEGTVATKGRARFPYVPSAQASFPGAPDSDLVPRLQPVRAK